MWRRSEPDREPFRTEGFTCTEIYKNILTLPAGIQKRHGELPQATVRLQCDPAGSYRSLFHNFSERILLSMGTMFPVRRLSYGLLFGVYCGKSAEKTQKYMLLQREVS